MKFGKRYVWLLMKTTIWNGYGILVARIGLTSINIAEAVKRFAAYMRKKMALDLWLFSGKMKEQNLKIYGVLFLTLFAGNMMQQKPIVTENGSCLNQPIRMILMTT